LLSQYFNLFPKYWQPLAVQYQSLSTKTRYVYDSKATAFWFTMLFLPAHKYSTNKPLQINCCA
jgi:hypothetical protein